MIVKYVDALLELYPSCKAVVFGPSRKFLSRESIENHPDKEVPFTKGQVIVSKKGECHGAKNTGTEDIVFVSIVAPVPADYDPGLKFFVIWFCAMYFYGGK